jgi:hypothetical protein
MALIGCTLLGAVLMTGCGTTPATKMAQVEQPIITTVNDAMAEWRDYVNAGKAKQSQIDSVKEAYVAYYIAQQVVKGVNLKLAQLETDPSVVPPTPDEIKTAQGAFTQAELALIALVNEFVVSKL